MKTKPWNPVTPKPTPELTAEEFSIADVVLVRIGDKPASKFPIVPGFYCAILAFRSSVPFEVTSDRAPEPLISYDGTTLKALPSIVSMLVDFENICKQEQEVGAELATAAFESSQSSATAPPDAP